MSLVTIELTTVTKACFKRRASHVPIDAFIETSEA
jgi:hypothetical protein